MQDFDEARNATEELFAQPTLEDVEQVSPETTEETPVQEIPPEQSLEETPVQQLAETQVLDEATRTAELATQVAAQQNAQVQQLQQELAAMREQNTQLQSTVEELSHRNEEHVIEDALEMPVLDVSSLTFADEAAVKAAQEGYAQKMAEYVKANTMQELQPFIDYAKEGRDKKERDDAIALLSQVPELSGIGDMMPQIERIIAGNDILSSDSLPIDQKLIMAYAIAQGVNAMNAPKPKELTSDELMNMYNNNTEFQEAVEKQRIDKLKAGQDVPLHSASSGAVNAALNVKEKPKNFDEASERTRRMFGLDY